MSSAKPIYSVPYILWWNDRPYEIDADVFARFSKKFKADRELPENQNQMDIEVKLDTGDDVPEDVFLQFVAACQLRTFDVNKKNVHMLMEIARKWQVSSLATYVEDYIRKNRIDPPETPDYLQILLDRIEESTDTHKDWANVANHINACLEDPRFERIPTEIIYEILDIADKKNLDPKALIKFVMKMLKKKPEATVPLILRLDFEKMTQEQRLEIFNTAVVHSANINFFTASSISALKNKNNITVEKRKRKQTLDFKCLEYALDKMCEKQLDDLKTAYRDEVEEIKDEIFRQQAIIDKLKERVREHERRVNVAEKKQLSRRVPIDAQALQDLRNAVKRELSQMADEIDEAVKEHERSMKHFAEDARDRAEKFFTQMAAESSNEQNQLVVAMKRLEQEGREASQNVLAVKAELSEVRAIVLAKIVRDRLRYSQYLRNTTNRFALFEKEPRVFGLTAPVVKSAEDELKIIDRRLEEICPLRMQGPPKEQPPVPKRVAAQMAAAPPLDLK